MADRGDLITTEDFTDLKKMVDSEISRRSADGSIGSMSAYGGAEYQYSTAPSRDIEIGREYIRKITEPLDAIDGVETTPRKGTIILAETMRNALAKLNDLSSRSKTESARGAEQAVLVCVLLDAIAVAPVVQEAALVAPAAETVVAAVVAAPVAAGTFSE